MMDKYTLPKYIDAPLKIIFFTIDEFLALLLPIIFGMFILHAPVTGVVVGLILMMLIKKVKGDQGHYFIYYLSYWYLPAIVQFKKTPPSYKRFYIR